MNAEEFSRQADRLLSRVSELDAIQGEIASLRGLLERSAVDTRQVIDEYLRSAKDSIRPLWLQARRAKEEAEEYKRTAVAQGQKDTILLELMLRKHTDVVPWLADAVADYLMQRGTQMAEALERKRPPAPKASEAVRKMAREKRASDHQAQLYRSLVRFYESLCPDLKEYRDEEFAPSFTTLVEPEGELGQAPELAWISEAEYAELDEVGRSQLALGRYWEWHKDRRELGRCYERYIGYLYERDGFAVEYCGALQGIHDRGRDLVCHKPNVWEVVQCKCWAMEKVIREAYVFQLFGTAVAYWQEHIRRPESQQWNSKLVIPRMVTSTSLSDEARQFAEVLGVKYREDVKLEWYPCIKCNVSRKDGSRIYHLPFDQQYDRVKVEPSRGELYAYSVEEAFQLGFRRARRWYGDT